MEVSFGKRLSRCWISFSQSSLVPLIWPVLAQWSVRAMILTNIMVAARLPITRSIVGGTSHLSVIASTPVSGKMLLVNSMSLSLVYELILPFAVLLFVAKISIAARLESSSVTCTRYSTACTEGTHTSNVWHCMRRFESTQWHWNDVETKDPYTSHSSGS
jgi:hypothetical protein